jgi:hypothetical protein
MTPCSVVVGYLCFAENIILPFSGFKRVERLDYADTGTGEESLHDSPSSFEVHVTVHR